MKISKMEVFMIKSGLGAYVYQAYENDNIFKTREKRRDLEKKQNFERQLKRFLNNDKT